MKPEISYYEGSHDPDDPLLYGEEIDHNRLAKTVADRFTPGQFRDYVDYTKESARIGTAPATKIVLRDIYNTRLRKGRIE